MNIIIVGSGISGLSAAIQSAQNGMKVTLLSPYPSERAQSVMAAGGFNAAVGPDDSVDIHKNLGITRCQEGICDGLGNINELADFIDKNSFDPQN